MTTYILIYLILLGCIVYGFQENTVHYCPSIITANYSVEINITVDDKNETTVHFPVSTSKYPFRVFASSKTAQPDYPVFVVVKQQKEVTSWEIPLLVESKTETLSFVNTSRTLCHNDMDLIARQNYGDEEYYKQLSVSISTFSPIPVIVTLYVKEQTDFYVELDKSYTALISPSTPKYYYYRYSKADKDYEGTVIIDVNSLDVTCLTVSIQNIDCPVFDLNEDIKYDGKYETINTRGGIIIQKQHFPNGFFIIFVANPDNYDCDGENLLPNKIPKKITPLNRTSRITFTIKENITPQEYIYAVGMTVLIIIVVSGFFMVISLLFCILETKWRHFETPTPTTVKAAVNTIHSDSSGSSSAALLDEASLNDNNPIVAIASGSGYGSVQSNKGSHPDKNDTSEMVDEETPLLSKYPKTGNVNHPIKVNPSINVNAPINVDPPNPVDPYRDIDILLAKPHLKLSDLATKTSKHLNSESYNFVCYVITFGIVYGTPVAQLVIMHQRIMNLTGNLDMCYYNFLCAHPANPFDDFNHFLSNLAYIFAGSLYIIITIIRHRKVIKHIDNCGIPQHFGLDYAMGTAVIIEGVLSAFYHICPSQEDYQFDTSFMYVISVLFFIKLYQNRHPDINATAHVVFILLVLTICNAAIGILFNHIAVWIVFTVLYSLGCVYIFLVIYYVNHPWRGCTLFFRGLDRSNFFQSIKPVRKARCIYFGIVLVANLIGPTIALCLKINHKTDFGTFLLGILMLNTIVYTIAYTFIFKLMYGEEFTLQGAMYLLLCAITWPIAYSIFMKHSTEWTKTAANSRQENTYCVFLKFYDYHDIWHLVSACALFVSCMLLQTTDDKLINTPRSDIYVF